MNKELHVIVSFDMESDVGSWTDSHEGVARATPLILEILDRHDVKSTFFYTGDAVKASPESLRLAQSAGHEIGCHTLQHESLGPPLFETAGARPVLPEEVPNRLEKATALITELAGERPVSFRAPRGWGSNEMVVVLDRLGYLVDSSYMAYYFGEHLLPYHPSAEDWTRPGDLGILEIPLFGDLSVQSTDPFRRDRDQWPMLRMAGAGALAGAIMRTAELLWSQGKPALACLYLHPWEFIEVSPEVDRGEARISFHEFLWRNTGPAALAALDSLIGRLGQAGAQYHTLRGYRDLWVSQAGPAS